jgi:hypothetical protein
LRSTESGASGTSVLTLPADKHRTKDTRRAANDKLTETPFLTSVFLAVDGARFSALGGARKTFYRAREHLDITEGDAPKESVWHWRMTDLGSASPWSW